jgi:short-subunit dehydrogenase involved in D-alanine esterification of teichoic acids
MNKGAEIVEDLKKSTKNENIEVMELELNSFQSVRDFVERLRTRHTPINILICQ